GRCLGGNNDGDLCTDGSACGSGNCGLAGVPDISGLLSDDTDLTMNTLAPCGSCPSAPDPSCTSGFGGCQLPASEKKGGKEKLVAKFLSGPQLGAGAFGNPVGTGLTAYNLCVYDGTGALARDYLVDRGGTTCGTKPCWKNVGKPPGDPRHKGYSYKDTATTA